MRDSMKKIHKSLVTQYPEENRASTNNLGELFKLLL